MEEIRNCNDNCHEDNVNDKDENFNYIGSNDDDNVAIEALIIMIFNEYY